MLFVEQVLQLTYKESPAITGIHTCLQAAVQPAAEPEW